MRIAFVTTSWDRVRDDDTDRPLHDCACAANGITLDHVPWWQPAVDWARYDLVVLRSPWDYSERLGAFTAWLDAVDGVAQLHNPAVVVRWNLDKRYLLDLEAYGVPVVSTEFLADLDAVEGALRQRRGAEVVLKPNVSAGSRHTGRFAADAPAARVLARTILEESKLVMLQPCATSVAAIGEVSLVYFDGVVSHAFRKGPILAPGGGLLGGSYRERIESVEPSPEQRAVARAASVAVGRICRERFGIDAPLLYARYDVVRRDDGSEALLEAELFEPSFFLTVDAAAAGRFSRALQRRVRQNPALARPAASE